MVFLDFSQVHEIDNELILFRELFRITESEYYNSLLISQGGRITQHLVEFLYRNSRTLYHDLYNTTFARFLNECDFIPYPIKEFMKIINNYRKNAVHTLEDDEELDEIIFPYLETFNEVLKWFYIHCNKKGGIIRKFKQIRKTIAFLNRKIKSEEWNQIDNDFKLNRNSKNNELVLKIPKILDELKELKKIAYATNNTVEEMNNTVQDTNNTVHDIDDKVDQLKIELEQLNTDIKLYKEEVHETLKNNNNDEEREKIISDFANKCVKKIRNSFEITSIDDYELEKEILIESLGKDNWNKLSEQSKTFLITAKITFNKLNELEDIIDYSGVCLLVTKALEVELSKRFFKGFKKTFKGKPKSEYHTSLLDRNKNYVLKDNRCTLGTITYIFGQNEDKVPKYEYESNLLKIIDYSKNNYFTNLDSEIVQEKIIYYGELVETIRVKYRNPAAHTKELKCPIAKNCFNYILDDEQVLKTMLESFDK